MTRFVVTAAAVLCLATGFAGAAHATPQDQGASKQGLVHAEPKVPVIVDGVRYEPKEIHRFDGRELYFVLDLTHSDVLLAFTSETGFRTAVTAQTAAYHDRAATASANQYAVYYSADELKGDWLRVNSGSGYNDLRAVARGCGIFGCAGDWNDVISSVEIHGYQYLYRDPGYGGGYFWVIGDGWVNLSTYGFDNAGSSLNVWW
ncbi:hypothetical protein [Amycolatopsis sp. lyj-109]|uniref:hypothetical protein n=1 Tax=Amycolatopsis sp. lyj-109 TaxID=2789287 RepID=UPI00397CA7E3